MCPQVPQAEPGTLSPSSQLACGFREGLPSLCLLGSSSGAPRSASGTWPGTGEHTPGLCGQGAGTVGAPRPREAVGWHVHLCAHVLHVWMRDVCAQVVQDMDHVRAGGSGHWDLRGHDMEG